MQSSTSLPALTGRHSPVKGHATPKTPNKLAQEKLAQEKLELNHAVTAEKFAKQRVEKIDCLDSHSLSNPLPPLPRSPCAKQMRLSGQAWRVYNVSSAGRCRLIQSNSSASETGRQP